MWATQARNAAAARAGFQALGMEIFANPPNNALTVAKVPAGVEEGTRIRYTGEGDVGRNGGPSGDLYVVLAIKAHDFFG